MVQRSHHFINVSISQMTFWNIWDFQRISILKMGIHLGSLEISSSWFSHTFHLMWMCILFINFMTCLGLTPCSHTWREVFSLLSSWEGHFLVNLRSLSCTQVKVMIGNVWKIHFGWYWFVMLKNINVCYYIWFDNIFTIWVFSILDALETMLSAIWLWFYI